MCVVTVASNAHPRWILVAAGNRDEFHAREAAPLGQWEDAPSIIAGRDLLSQGTWFGVSSAGRFGVVTNVRSPDGPDPQKASRGALVTNWLAKSELPNDPDMFNPFNLLVTDQKAVHYVSNRPSASHMTLGAGMHSLSNAEIGASWPRKDRLEHAVKNWLKGDAHEPTSLFDIMADRGTDSADEYPLFIANPVYGTRCSTILSVDSNGLGHIIERRFNADGAFTGESSATFRWPV